MLKREQIKSISWEQLDESEDDGDPLYQGNLTINLIDGTSFTVFLDWVRSGDEDDFSKGDIDAVIAYEKGYGLDLK
jgi:hypothetical protein